jgi:Spy/CpxP family protein refolding chaperone
VVRQGDVTWSNPKVLTTLALLFLCGVTIGSALTRVYLHSHWPAAVSNTPAIERVRHVGLGDLKQKLNLTPAQEQIITKILDDYGKFYQNIEDEREDVAAVGKQRILEALTPAQQQRFNELIGGHQR